MAKPLYDEVIRYARSCPERFHMPAHFGANLDDLLYLSSVFDVTELPFTDNLQSPSGIIAASERQTAESYGSEASLYFTTGATTAIYTALGALREYGDEIIIARASHKSVYAAARFFGYKVSYIDASTNEGLPTAVTAEEIERAIKRSPKAMAVVITSPTYFGASADVERVLSTVKKYGKRLVVDEAHGAHFPFSDLLPEGFSGRADLTVESLHKTLPVYTGGAVLNVGDKTLIDKARALRADLHTTSPSYVVLASMDFALDELRLYGEVLYEKLYNRVKKLKANLSAFTFYDGADFSRVVIKLGKGLIAKLYSQNVVPEMAYGDWAVFITSPYNMERLDVLEGLLTAEKAVETATVQDKVIVPTAGEVGDEYEVIPLKSAIGRTAFAEAGVYPPGIPLVAQGELLTDEIVNTLLSADDAFGIIDGKIRVIKKGTGL